MVGVATAVVRAAVGYLITVIVTASGVGIVILDFVPAAAGVTILIVHGAHANSTAAVLH